MQEQMKTCPHCRSEINAQAKKCPQCQTDLRNWFSRHKLLTLLGVVIGLPIFIGIVSSSLDGARQKSNELKQQTTATQPAPQATTPAAAELQSLSVGDEGYLRISDTANTNQNICVGTTKKDADDITKALLAKDYFGLLNIPGAFCVGNGSKIKLIEKDFPYRKVRIVSGVKPVDSDKVGMAGYVPAEWVVNK